MFGENKLEDALSSLSGSKKCYEFGWSLSLFASRGGTRVGALWAGGYLVFGF